MPFEPAWFLSAELFFAVCPLSILLFAFEMTALEIMGKDKVLTDKQCERRLLLYFCKLPGSLILPVVLGNIGGVVIAALDVWSIAILVQEARREIAAGYK